jgi:uncharacterized protein
MFQKLACAIVVASFFSIGVLRADPLPDKPVGRVNDFAALLSAEQVQSLEQALKQLDADTTVEIVVVTVRSLDGKGVENYAREIAQKWQVGKAGKDNGIVLLMAPNERRSQILTARGALEIIPNRVAANITQNVMIPRFKAKDVAGGVVAGTERLIAEVRQALGAEAKVERPMSEGQTSEAPMPTGAVGDKPIPWDGILKVVALIATIAVGTLVAIYLTTLRDNRRAIRGLRDGVNGRLTALSTDVEHSDVKRETRDRLPPLKYRFSAFSVPPVDELNSRQAEEIREDLSRLSDEVSEFDSQVRGDIQDAATARVEGPSLLLSLPVLIQTVEDQVVHEAVTEERRTRLADTKQHFVDLQLSAPQEPAADWRETYLSLRQVKSGLDCILRDALQDVAKYREAQVKVPELVERLRVNLDGLEQRQKAGGDVREQELAQARAKYQEAMNLRGSSSSLGVLELVMLYQLLTTASDHADSAVVQSSYSSSSDDHSWNNNDSDGGISSYDPGGGGGFDVGSSGGSTGEW